MASSRIDRVTEKPFQNLQNQTKPKHQNQKTLLCKLFKVIVQTGSHFGVPMEKDALSPVRGPFLLCEMMGQRLLRLAWLLIKLCHRSEPHVRRQP